MTSAAIDIVDVEDPRIDGFCRLTDMHHRLAREPSDGIFVAEGRMAIQRALAAHWEPISLLGPRRFVDEFDHLSEVPRYVADDDLLAGITGFRVHRGCLGLFARRPELTPFDLLQGARRLLVLEDLVDHANVGAGFRSAAAFAVDAVLLSPGCADPLYRRAIKVSMGATLTVPFARMTDWPSGLSSVRESGFEVWAMTPAPDAETLDEVSVPARVALMFGTEGTGLGPAVQNLADRRIRIPMSSAVDSLNVAAAVAVTFFATRPGPS